MNLKIENAIDQVRLLLRKDKEPYLRLYQIMGFYPHNLAIYHVALMHRSSTSTSRYNRHVNNERLEFLGDAILGAVVASIVYDRYKNRQEGFLTTLRSKLVKRETLNELAVKIGLDKLVIHSDHMTNAHNSYMNGNAFEAFIGAIYLDRGYDYCMYYIRERILQTFIDIDKTEKKEENFKSKVIEWCQRYQCDFDFVITSEKMDTNSNAPKFVAEIQIEGVTCGKGTGYTKKESHQNAAEQGYKKVKSDVAFVSNLLELRNKRVKAQGETVKENGKKNAQKPREAVVQNQVKPSETPFQAQPQKSSANDNPIEAVPQVKTAEVEKKNGVVKEAVSKNKTVKREVPKKVEPKQETTENRADETQESPRRTASARKAKPRKPSTQTQEQTEEIKATVVAEKSEPPVTDTPKPPKRTTRPRRKPAKENSKEVKQNHESDIDYQ